MTTPAQLRRTALSLPGTAEQDAGSGTIAFTVRGERFASLGEDGQVRLHLPAAEVDEFLAAHPTAERLTRGATPTGVRVLLGDVDGRRLDHWVRRAWLSCAPERSVEQAAAAEAAVPGEDGDLPRAIGRPATQALTGAGLTTLARVAELTEAELLAMHGVGPKAVRILREALGATGRTLG
ncbi:hypothetical protein Ppa06_67550 [Planomonospora parontospora subsp. parontospora]|uniref:DNA-binding protein n=2 Tax=Planomonospora parontospora TaxID=58119 RepID=A0AA37BPE8_9ACTN|nr:hypothetical protein [Planomonospora parontospora]GGK99254.1 hypothetical protein GCM10010126_68400 [Planomonospora parontospora]GII12957.1 hypothetical protein Ppa06_67550 [Planomonospora parontospora subsp. parontospora]